MYFQNYKAITQAVEIPVLANMTEFGKTPLFTTEELASVGVAMVLYPLSAFRAMAKAGLTVYREIREAGTQAGVLQMMQTRQELYEILDYHRYEQALEISKNIKPYPKEPGTQ